MKNKKWILAIAVIVLIILSGMLFFSCMLKHHPNMMLRYNTITLTEGEVKTVSYTYKNSSVNNGHSIHVFTFTPNETAEYTLSISNIKKADDIFLKVFMTDKDFNDYMNDDSAADGGDIEDSATLNKGNACIIIVEADSEDENMGLDYEGSFDILIQKTSDAVDIPDIKVDETIKLNIKDEVMRAVRFIPEESAYYNFTPYIASKDDSMGTTYVTSIMGSDNKEVKNTQGVCYLKEGNEYYIWIKAQEINGKEAEVELSCAIAYTENVKGYGSYPIKGDTVMDLISETEGNILVYSKSDGEVSAVVFDERGYPIASDDGAGSVLSGNEGDFALVIQALKGEKYSLYIDGVFNECDIVITGYRGDGRSIGPDDAEPLESEAEENNAE